MRDNFIFYRSFYEGAKVLKDSDRLKLYEAIFEYALDNTEPKLKGYPLGMFSMARPQLDANNKRYQDGLKGAEHGKKGGRHKKNKLSGDNEENPIGFLNKTPNENVNDNENDNVNENVNTSDEEAIKLVLDTGEYYSVTNEQIQGWQQSVPLVDVKSELRKMQLWLEGNPKKRKTTKGITRFITGWLVREQNSKEQNSKPITGVEDVPDWYGNTKQTEPTPELLEEIEKMKESMRL
ncbi:DUF6291 domain-containing protein [Faecalicoccus sp.]|uniref:DUF6291 domain-containing protein n=1 Tax=Faecalicoccus sp. TaxID=1971758 RepID=UPI002A840864|nr:DUF6291 domain-containing protein [Faecalicoccus sp.]MDY5110763.1 DUF6291 domain-containing protein [Faecalicoccus sp.]